MVKQYGTEKAKKVFYASRNSGKITGVDPVSKKKAKKKKKSKSKSKSMKRGY